MLNKVARNSDAEGRVVNRKKTQPLHREEDLTVRECLERPQTYGGHVGAGRGTDELGTVHEWSRKLVNR